MSTVSTSAISSPAETQGTVFRVLGAVTVCHFVNDMLQSVIPAAYPILKDAFHLDFSQVGMITLAMQITASLLQPAIGLYTDSRPKPFALPVGMSFTLAGLLLLSMAPVYGAILLAVAMVGIGSAVFHPESSRIARMASGGRHGMAQSLFQLGGYAGAAMGPLVAAFVVLPLGQRGIAWFALVALIGIALLTFVGNWYRQQHRLPKAARKVADAGVPSAKVKFSIAILIALVFSKNVYLVSLTNYFTFYLIQKFGVSVRDAQIHLFVLLGATALGTFIGGPVGDRIGRKYVIWLSILGVLPFTLALPYANLFWTGILTVIIGLILSSAFSAIVVFAQELVPGKVGAISGLFFGLAFGVAGIGAALLGQLADATSIEFVYKVCSYLPAIGLLTAFLPHLEPARARR